MAPKPAQVPRQVASPSLSRGDAGLSGLGKRWGVVFDCQLGVEDPRSICGAPRWSQVVLSGVVDRQQGDVRIS